MLFNINVQKLCDHATIPKYQSAGAAGFDFHASESKVIMPGETELISTGLAFEIPQGYELQVRPRSGMSLKTKLRVSNAPGTIDSDYRGEVKIIIDNNGHSPYTIEVGDRIAQGVITQYLSAPFSVVEELSKTDRGSGGFGSTGK